MNEPAWWMFLVGAYLAGSIPFGLIIGMTMGVDIRQHGSHNIGANNCGRILGREWGLTCFILDVLKGFGPVFAAGWFFHWIGGQTLEQSEVWRWLLVGVAAIVGHIFPVWLKFRGGKGVSTGLGVILGVWPYLTIPALGAGAMWLVFAWSLRYVGLASVMASIGFVFWLWLQSVKQHWAHDTFQPFFIFGIAIVLLIVIRHWGNLQRLWRGTEARLGGGR